MELADPPNESLDTSLQAYDVFEAKYCNMEALNKYIGRSADPAGKSADIQKYCTYQNFGYENDCKLVFCLSKSFFVC